MALKENLEEIRTNVTDIKNTLYQKYVTEENTKLNEITNKLGRVPTIYTPEQKTYARLKYYTFNPDRKDWTEPEWNTRNAVITDLYLDLEENLPIDGFRAFMGYYQEGTIVYNLKSIHSSTGKLFIVNGDRMFLNCKNLKELPVIEFSSRAININQKSTQFMFSGCENLEYLSFKGHLFFSTHTSTVRMFQNCKSLKEIKGFDISQFTGIPADTFLGCTNLKFIDFSDTTEYYSSLSQIHLENCTAMLGEDLFRTLMTLPQNTKTDGYITIYLTTEQRTSLINLNIVAPYFSNANGTKMYFKASSYTELTALTLLMLLKGFGITTS